MLKEVYFIATPIGDLGDISLRALKLFEKTEVILVEEYRVAKKLFEQLKIDFSKKEIIELNEHNERREAQAILERLMLRYPYACLISDCGMPALADSGQLFLKHCVEMGIEVRYVPGASSILGALLVSGFQIEPFYYAGFLPRKEAERKRALAQLKSIQATLVIMETPYRLAALLRSVKQVFGKKIKLALAFNLTKRDEKIVRTTVEKALSVYETHKNKKNFVLVLNHSSKKF